MHNLKITEIFNKIADLLELKGESIFRISAYRKAALNIESLSEDISEIAKRSELRKISGIGADLEEKIILFLKTGKVDLYEKLLKTTPKVLLDLIKIQGIGPKRADLIYKKLKIKSVNELEKRINKGLIKNLPGFREKSFQNILRGIEFAKHSQERMNLGVVYPIANNILSHLKNVKELDQVVVAGSIRRMKDTVKDIDILAVSKSPEKVMDYFVSLEDVKEVLAKGPTKSSVIIKEGLEVDLRVVKKDSFGAALCYFTGSKAHNVKLREMAVKRNLKINEYGIFKKGKKLGGKNEEDIYRILGLEYILPELREDTGEIEAASKKMLPHLIKIEDIKGDFHVHSTFSDGAMNLEAIVESSVKKGYAYVAVSDHSKSLKIAGGLSRDELITKIRAIDKLNGKLRNFRILKSAEVDILSDGSLDYKDGLLKELDIVIAAIHSGFKENSKILTRRIVSAMKSKYIHIIAHLTGRLFGIRPAYEVDLDEILKVALDTNTALEINGFPERLDINDAASRLAKEKKVSIAISTDAHTKEQLNNMLFGLSVARRGWLEKKDVLNSLPYEALLKKIKK